MSYIERIRASGRDANPFFRLMGIEVVSLSEGRAVVRMKIRDDMLNGENFLQGGMFTALADEAMVLAIYSVLENDQKLATISESTSFMRGAGPGTILAAEGMVIKKGRRIAFAEGLVRIEGKEDILSRTSAAFAITTGR
ncbi:MAG TPA: PaaI family thioesterase [Methanoregulaceae archaeon]|nr:PaaI family thioesterase [Methanoregulaceae archaeon]